MGRDLEGTLRARGLRVTTQRRLVLEAVRELGHGTPDDIAARVRVQAGEMSLSTVYRALELLEDLALVTHTHLDHRAPTYHVVEEADHLHLVCSSCGSVLEVDPGEARELVERLAAHHGFRADVRHMAIHGRCERCSRTTGEATGPLRALEPT